MVCDTISYVNKAIKEKKKVIVEGANATMLDIDFGKNGTLIRECHVQGLCPYPACVQYPI